jgi:hypothetical protein
VGAVVAAPAVEKRPAPAEPPKGQEPQWITVNGPVLPVFSKDDHHFVPGGLVGGLRLGRSVKVVGPPDMKGRRRLLGSATVIKAVPRRGGVVVSLDAAAAAAPAERFVVLPMVEAAAQPAVASPEPELELEPAQLEVPNPPQPAAPPRTLVGSVKRSSFLGLGAIDKGLVIRNAGDTFWSDCKATLAGKRQVIILGVPRKSEKAVDQDSFKPHVDAPLVGKDELHLECKEGTSLFKIRK